MQTVKLLSLAAMLALSVCLTGCKDFEAKASQDVPLISYSETTRLREYCVNGYRYLVHKDYGTGGLTQMWEDGPNGPRPIRCGPLPEKPVS